MAIGNTFAGWVDNAASPSWPTMLGVGQNAGDAMASQPAALDPADAVAVEHARRVMTQDLLLPVIPCSTSSSSHTLTSSSGSAIDPKMVNGTRGKSSKPSKAVASSDRVLPTHAAKSAISTAPLVTVVSSTTSSIASLSIGDNQDAVEVARDRARSGVTLLSAKSKTVVSSDGVLRNHPSISSSTGVTQLLPMSRAAVMAPSMLSWDAAPVLAVAEPFRPSAVSIATLAAAAGFARAPQSPRYV